MDVDGSDSFRKARERFGNRVREREGAEVREKEAGGRRLFSVWEESREGRGGSFMRNRPRHWLLWGECSAGIRVEQGGWGGWRRRRGRADSGCCFERTARIC